VQHESVAQSELAFDFQAVIEWKPKLVPNPRAGGSIRSLTLLFDSIAFLATENTGCEIFLLPPRSRTTSFSYDNNGPGCLRLKNRRQRDHFQVGRVHQLDAEKFSLANANGPRLLRD